MDSLSPDEAVLSIQDVIASIVQSAQFIPSSKEDLIEYINQHGFDIEEISREVLYRCDSALISEGILDECVVKIASYLGIENLDDDFVLDYRDYIIDELIDQNRDIWGQDEEDFLNTYENPINYICFWVSTCLREYLRENPEEIGLIEDEDGNYGKIEEWLDNTHEKILEQIYQEAESNLASVEDEDCQE